MNDRTSSRYQFYFPPSLQSQDVDGMTDSIKRDEGDRYEPDGVAMGTAVSGETRRRKGNPVRVLIVGDHPIYRDGLRKLIESQPEMCVSGESPVGFEVIALARELRPDIVLIDIDSPGRSGLQVLNELADLPLPVPALMVAAAVEESTILEAFCLGARGIVLKGSARELLLKSIRNVLAGQYWLDQATVPIFIAALRKSPPSPSGETRKKDCGLTPRELKIVKRVAKGSSNKEVGREFSISERTVKHHLTNIFNKLGLSGRVELAVFALQHGLVSKG